MVVLPGGTFVMGSPPEEEGRSENEGPLRKGRVTGFALARNPLTFEEFDAFCSATGRTPPSDEGGGRGRRPVTNVSWEDAQAYLTWLNGLVSDGTYRLPSETEWEYAARAGTTTPYARGEIVMPDGARFLSEGELIGSTPVGELASENAWGLRHMHGEVWEWVEDCWHENYEGAPEDGRAWLWENGGDCSRRVARGAAWRLGRRLLFSTIRFGFEPNDRNKGNGFRPAMTLTPHIFSP
jgi:formylglycine-generating enzyme required for sulfatase activity